MEAIFALTIDGRLTKCTASEENRGKGRCNHISHQLPSENLMSFIERASKEVEKIEMGFSDLEMINQNLLTMKGENKFTYLRELYVKGEFNNQNPFNNRAFIKNHNLEAYHQALSALENAGECTIVQATGTGKSSIILATLEAKKGDPGFRLVFSPRVGILQQFSHEAKNNPRTVLFTYQKFLKDYKLDNLQSYRSLFPEVSLIVLDEIHHIENENQWSEAIETLTGMYPKAKILGATATKTLSKAKYGDCISNKDLERCFLEGITPIPKYRKLSYDFDYYSDYLEKHLKDSSRKDDFKQMIRFKEKEIKEATEKEIKDTLKDKINKCDEENRALKIIGFCQNKDHMNKLMRTMEESYKRMYPDRKINVYGVDSGNSKSKAIIDSFNENGEKGEINIMMSIKMFNEGYHLEGVETAMLFTHTQNSDVDYKQQIGRVLGMFKKDPVILDFANRPLDKSLSKMWKNLNMRLPKFDYKESVKYNGNITARPINIKEKLKEIREIININTMWKKF